MNTVKLLQKLIQIPSPSGHEKDLADYILALCQNNAIPAKKQDGNIIIYLKGKNQNKALIFNAHMDTVTAGNNNLWKYPPTGKRAGQLINGKIYGLGASDNKGAITTMLLLAKSINIPPCDVWFTFVVCEETDGSGTENFLSWFIKSEYYTKYKKIAAIIGEATNLDSIEIGHRGNAFIKLRVSGITGHGAKNYSSSDLAVEKMLKTLEKLQKTFKQWKKQYKDPIVGEPNMNITSLHTSDEFMNKIPDQCWVTLDIRTTPKFHRKLDNLLKKAVGDSVKISKIKTCKPPAITSFESHVIKVCKKVLPDIPLTISLGSTDHSQFTRCEIDTIVLGPGNKEVIHKENEYVKLQNIDKAVDVYQKLIFAYATT